MTTNRTPSTPEYDDPRYETGDDYLPVWGGVSYDRRGMCDGTERRCVDCGERIDEVWLSGDSAGHPHYPLPVIVCDACSDEREIARGMATWLVPS